MPVLVEANRLDGGAVTVAVNWRPLLGVLKPAGTPTVSTLMPAATGANAVLALLLSPGLKTAGLPTIVPTDVVPLVTGTLTVRPPRTACWPWKASVVGSSTAGPTASGMLPEKLVVVKSPPTPKAQLPEPLQNTKPDGPNATGSVSGA